MRKGLVVAWSVIPALLLSAFVHSVDPDVGGIRGLASPSALLSVLFYGALAAALALLCLGLAVRFHWVAWVSVSALLSAAIALALAQLQRPRPGTRAGLARPFPGGAVLVWLVLTIAVVPAQAVGWPGRQRRLAG